MENNNSFKEFTDWIFSLSGIDYTIAAVTIGVIMSKGLDVNEQNSVGSFFFLIGQVLITINAQNITQTERIDNPTNISNGELNRRIEFLFNELNNIKRNL
jgi:hypothetical protein